MNGFDPAPPRLWRHDQGAMFAGVCAGLAEDLDLPLPLVRFVSLLFLLLPTGLAYLALGVLLRRRPQSSGLLDARRAASATMPDTRTARSDAGPSRRQPASTPSLPPHQDWALLRHRLAALEPRISRIEGVVTADDFELRRDFRAMDP